MSQELNQKKKKQENGHKDATDTALTRTDKSDACWSSEDQRYVNFFWVAGEVKMWTVSSPYCDETKIKTLPVAKARHNAAAAKSEKDWQVA